MLHLTADEYEAFIADAYVGERIAGQDGTALLVVSDANGDLSDPGSLPVVVGYLGDALGGEGPSAADLVVSDGELDELVDTVTSTPYASVSLALLLRHTIDLSVDHGLAAESAVYSALQGSGEFAAWRGEVEPILHAERGRAVLVERRDDTMLITLDRPHRHNAITRQLRDELCQALAVAVLDGSITRLQLSGNGPSFCSGGDLAEFGSRPDPATGHRTRLAQSPARLIHRLRDRVAVHIHGAALGGGIEMAAFAHHVSAHPATHIGLPEVGIGLIPGAGGTVSMTRRIGRQRTAALALATDTIDAETALDWGLVDEIVEHRAPTARSGDADMRGFG